MIPLLFAALTALVGYSVGRNTKSGSIVSGAEPVKRAGFVWIPDNPMTGVPGHWERERAIRPGVVQQAAQNPVAILMQLVQQGLPVSPGLAQAAYQQAMTIGDMVTAQQIAMVFFPPPMQQQTPPPIMVGEEESEALQQTYSDAEPMKAVTTSVINNPPPAAPPVSDVSPDEWREFLHCFKTRAPDYRGERHIGAFEQSARRLSQLGLDPANLTTEESQLAALDKDLNNYLQTCERMLNDFTGESVNVNGSKVSVTRSGILALLKAAGPAGAKGWLTEEHQRKAFPHTTEIFTRGNGRF